MSKRSPKPTEPVPHPPQWDFVDLLNTDIGKLEVAQSLRQLGQIRVMDWDFGKVLPTVKKTANREVDVIDLLRRTANYKIMDWDFRSPSDKAPADSAPSSEIQALTIRLKNFLEYVTTNLIDEPANAQIRVSEIAPKVLRFTVVLVRRDVAMLIGREGFTATAIRSVMKAMAGNQGANVLLQIHSHEEEQAIRNKENQK